MISRLKEKFLNTNKLTKILFKYGFIVRYPEGKEEITKYDYEPWHLRYVGIVSAKQIMSSSLTLEQYLFKNFEL
jgi:D-alanyl-D-alanine carboxypeptidase